MINYKLKKADVKSVDLVLVWNNQLDDYLKTHKNELYRLLDNGKTVTDWRIDRSSLLNSILFIRG